MTLWLQITSGQGPAECQWVVARLLACLKTEAEADGLELELLEAIEGEQSGIFRSVLVSLDGVGSDPFAASWVGTVQWVGRSPYRPRHKRKNWFVGVERFDPPSALAWSEDELQIEVMRSSGPGGQHVNKTSSAVRITHLPTGVSALAREERSQHRNRALALARLAQLLAGQNAQVQSQAAHQRWSRHAELVRGNAIRVYEGPDFRLRR